MAKRTKFIFTEKLARALVALPENLKRAGFGYAMNYGLGRIPASDEPVFESITREIERANRESAHCTAEDVRQIIGHLNEVLGTSYRDTSEATRRKINARFGEGYTVEDFRLVIDHMKEKWSGTEQADYLRPETLFGAKFEGYLQSAKSAEGKSSFDTDDFFAAALARTFGGDLK